MTTGFPWSELDIAATGDAKSIRSAYAARIKVMDIDADVAGYARLRDARDTALRLAKQIAAGKAPPAEEVDEEDWLEALDDVPVDLFADEPIGKGWLNGAPDLSGSWPIDPALSASPPAPAVNLCSRVSPDFIADDHGEGGSDAEILAPLPGSGLGAPLVEGHDAAAAIGQARLQSPFMRLAALLSPDDPADNAPLTEAEEAQGHAILCAILEIVHQSDISRQEEIENWLAALLAQSWPRSAPLLDSAEAAFDWHREWGKVDARPTIEYLGARLRGYRFRQKVAVKGHRYHKAWVELSRPGKAGPFRFWSANSTDVNGLLSGIRRHFPEIEEHLDAERIASWERGSAWSTAALVIAGLIVMGILFSINDERRGFTSGGVEFAAEMRATHQASKAAMTEAFGPEHDTDWLKGDNSGLSITIDGLSRAAVQSDRKQGGAEATRLVTEMVRKRLYLNGRITAGDDFEQVMRLRLDLLKAAQAKDTATCITYLNSGQLSAMVPLPQKVRTRERQLAASFAERGLLGNPVPSGPTKASVPGILVGKVLDATKLPKDVLAEAMQGKGSDANRCAVSIALLEATLDWQGDERRAILLTL